jgi:plastocyanin
LLVATLAAIGLAVPGAVGARGEVAQPLLATVGAATAPNAYRISLVDATGATVTHLDPGTYTINVHDYATLHNFDLFGSGVQQASDIEGTTTTLSWVVTFQNGTYHYQCDAHPTLLHGAFTVGTVPAAPKQLVGRVGPGQTISLKTAAGARVKSVTAGRYKIAVHDATKVDNFHLLGPGINKKTGVTFRGSVTWSVTFTSGPVTYRSDAHKKLHGSFSVLARG